MKSRSTRVLVVGVALSVAFVTRAQQPVKPIIAPRGPVRPIGIPVGDFPAPVNVVQSPVNFIGVIPIPGNPFASGDISWVDQVRGRAYLADRSNFGIDIFDLVNNVFVGRVTRFVGPTGSNGAGPNGMLVTEDNKLWAGDYPVNDHVSLVGFLVNGWNNAVDNNTAKTVGVQARVKPILHNVSTAKRFESDFERVSGVAQLVEAERFHVRYGPVSNTSSRFHR